MDKMGFRVYHPGNVLGHFRHKANENTLLIMLITILFLFLSISSVYATEYMQAIKAEQEAFNNREDQILVQYKEPVSSKRSMKMFSQTFSGERITPDVEVIKLKNQADSQRVMEALQKDPQVLYVEKDKKVKLHGIPNDPGYANQWHLKNIRAEEAWATIPSSQSPVVVAVIDSGIDYGHIDLVNRIAPGGYNFIVNSNNVLDVSGHGTLVSGIIAAETNNAIGIAGVAGTRDIRILPLKTASYNGESYVSDVIKSIDYAITKNVDIINLSMGSESYSNIENAAIQRAIQKGIVVVASAGNEGRAAYQYPASYDNVISVGSTSKNNTVSQFSNYNDKVDVVAPGEDIYSCHLNNSYKFVDGTSFSAPVIAGIASVLKSINPSLTRNQVEYIIQTSAIDRGPAGKDNYYGYGAADFVAAVRQVCTIPVTGVFLNANKLDLKLGDSATLTATISPINATNKIISWATDNPNVATIDSTGLVRAVGVGNALIMVITAEGGFTAVCNVVVNDVNPAFFEGVEWPARSGVPSDKVWTIRFTMPLNENTITGQNIYVTDTVGQKIPVTITPGSDGLTVKVSAEEFYLSGQTYYLYIKSGVCSRENQHLPASLRMKFTIQ